MVLRNLLKAGWMMQELLLVLEEAEGRNSGLETSMRELRAAAGREKFKEQQAHKRCPLTILQGIKVTMA